LDPLRRSEWVVYAKRPFAGPTQVLAYLARYTHRVAIANSRLVSLSGDHVRFRWKDYRQGGQTKVMTLDAGEFMRRFLLHTLPSGFQRIRYYGLFANGHRADRLRLCRQLLEAVPSLSDAGPGRDRDAPRSAPDPHACPCCGGWMVIIESLFDYGMECSSRV
jgi:Putative transposase